MNLKIFRSYFYDWRFYFKLIFGLIFLGTLIYDWLNPLIYGIKVPENQKALNWEWFIQDKGDYTLNFLCSFTVQTNIMVALWFIGSAIFHNQEGKVNSKWFGQYMSLAVTIFITITGVIFNTVLLWTKLKETGFYFWFTNVIEHMICPIVMVVYFLFFMKREKNSVVSTKIFWKKYLWRYFLFPFVWIVTMLIRGEFRYQAGKAWAYRYFFINIHKDWKWLPGWSWLIIVGIFLILIVFGFSTWFNYITYKKQTKKN